MAPPTKIELRKEFLAKRNALDIAGRARDSSLIRQRVFQHPAWKNAGILLCYVSFHSEVETHLLIQEALRYKKRVIVPVHDRDSDKTPLTELRRFSDLGPNHRGVLQVKPECHHLVDPEKVELALIPGIVFDKQGGRIGFGGGYFDRLLPHMPRTFRLGLGFSSQISSDPLPLERYDVRLHAIVTEKEVLDTKSK